MTLKTIGVTAVLVAIVAILAFVAVPKKACSEGCNVIFIMMDTLSAKHIETYGYSRETMPKTLAFFENRIIFDNATANSSWTLPSFTHIYFSNLAHTVTYRELDDMSRPTLQSEMRNAGVTIRAVVPQPTVFITDAITRPYEDSELRPSFDYEAFAFGTEEIAALAETENPFFLLVHTFEVHDPFEPRIPYSTLYEATDEYPIVTRNEMLDANEETPVDMEKADIFRLRYDQNIAQADANIAAFLESIPPSMLENTVVILSSDHGEAFGEHGRVWHAQSLYEEEVHIPLFMHVPGMKERRIANPVSHLDFAPTILSLMNIPVPDSFMGDDLTPLIEGNTFPEREIPLVLGLTPFLQTVTSESTAKAVESLEAAGVAGSDTPIIIPRLVGIRSGDQKVLRGPYAIRWFDLGSDPKEKNDLSGSDPAKLPEKLKAALDAMGPVVPPPN